MLIAKTEINFGAINVVSMVGTGEEQTGTKKDVGAKHDHVQFDNNQYIHIERRS